MRAFNKIKYSQKRFDRSTNVQSVLYFRNHIWNRNIFQLFNNCFIFTELDPAELYIPVDPNKIPKFLTKPTKFEIVTKDTVVLPCEVYNPGKFQICT